MVEKRVRGYLAAEEAASNDPYTRDLLLRTAKAALGTPYIRGGASTDGFDCSGFVQWTYNHVGIKLPRTAKEQSLVGEPVRNPGDLQAGDIVAFRHPKRGYHTGIYVGEGKFIHSPRKRTRVRIASLDDPYFSGTFLGARRVTVSGNADIAAAESVPKEYRTEKIARRSRAEASPVDGRSRAKTQGKNRLVAEHKKNSSKNPSLASAGGATKAKRAAARNGHAQKPGKSVPHASVKVGGGNAVRAAKGGKTQQFHTSLKTAKSEARGGVRKGAEKKSAVKKSVPKRG